MSGLAAMTMGTLGTHEGRVVAAFLVSWLMSLIPHWPEFLCLQPGCLDSAEAAQGCEGPLSSSEASMQADAQDVCYQLLDSPFRECHAQVRVGVSTAGGAVKSVFWRGAKQGIGSCHCFVCMISEVPSSAHCV